MRNVKLHRIDSFTRKIFAGNPTSVVVDAHKLTVDEMKNIAIEMNCPESAFILPSQNANVRLKYYTRSGEEFPFCGHATIGALQAIVMEGMFGTGKIGTHRLDIETDVGVLTMGIELSEKEPPLFKMDFPKIDLVKAPLDLEGLEKALEIPEGFIDDRWPVMLEKTNQYLYFAVPSLEKLKELSINMRKAAEFGQKQGLKLFCAFTPAAMDSRNHVHSRVFAPQVGIDEDPFTGSMQGGLAACLLHHKMIPETLSIIGSEQGHFMGRPGEARIELIKGKELKARLHAYAAPLFSTTLTLP